MTGLRASHGLVFLGLVAACSGTASGVQTLDHTPDSGDFSLADGGSSGQQHLDGGHGSSGSSSGGGSGSTSSSGGSSGSTSSSGSSSGSGSGSGSSGGSGSSSGSSSGAFAPFVPANMPQVIDFGGPVMNAPVFQSISFSGYDQVTQMDDLVATIGTGGGGYWKGAVGEYGVGTPSVQPPVHLAEAAPTSIDDSAIQTWLQGKVAAGGGFMAPSANALYVISYPSSSTITLQGLTSCQQFGGYHNSTTIGGVNVAYAVVPECTFAPMTMLETTTGSASHELIEAVTDPTPFANPPTYAQADDAHVYWEIVFGGGEVGDMCAQLPSAFFTPPGYTYMVQRTWSNASAKAGRDPCQPEMPGEIYFSAVPIATDTVSITQQGQSYPTGGIKIAQGASRTIPVQLYSEAPTGAWSVAASTLQGSSANLGFVWSKTSGKNGDTLQLTITANAFDSTFGGAPFVVVSQMGSQATYWLSYVAP